ncbi:hypothetical protein V6N13_078766 [Hibiscus sabdariffa]|uniref:Uncharacterized protein n=1 Tax=Hibiscus sabdariffa TaxID=183260 RepID=A0ABR2RPF1_9ROSI
MFLEASTIDRRPNLIMQGQARRRHQFLEAGPSPRSQAGFIKWGAKVVGLFAGGQTDFDVHAHVFKREQPLDYYTFPTTLPLGIRIRSWRN